MERLSGAVTGFQDTFSGPQMSEGKAIQRLLHDSKTTDMKDWLLLGDTLRLVNIFQRNAALADSYLGMAEEGRPEMIKEWIEMTLMEAGRGGP